MLLNGLELPAKPEESVPRLPRDPSDLTDSQLMTLLSKYTAWSSYLGMIVAMAEADEAESEGDMETLGAKIMVENWGGRAADRVTLSKAQRETDPEYIAARSKHMERKAYRKMVGRLYENVEGEKFTISRELTRRIGREPAERRDRKFNT